MSAPAEEIVTGELVPYVPGSAVEEYRPRIVMAPEEAKALDDQLRANMRAVLHEDSDYGVIPGTKGKPTLLKPGAEKLLQWFGFGFTMERAEIERDEDGKRLGVTYRCTVTKGLPDGRVVVIAMCEGYAGYDEDRFYTSAEDAEAKERANAERYRRKVNESKFGEYRAPWNSVIKMSQKRAMVGAALQATSASSLFTQDMEDVVADKVAPAALAEAGRAAIAALPAQVGAELDAWYTALNWPDPGTWDAEQWCKALIKAGEYSAAAKPPAQPAAAASPVTPAREAREEAPEEHAPDTREGWAAEHLTVAKVFEYEAQGRTLWKLTAEKARARDISRDQAKQIQDAITARITHIKAEGAAMGPLDPEEEWASLVENLAEEETADTKAEIRAEVAAGRISPAHADLIIAAINIRLLDLAGEKAAA